MRVKITLDVCEQDRRVIGHEMGYENNKPASHADVKTWLTVVLEGALENALVGQVDQKKALRPESAEEQRGREGPTHEEIF